MAGALYLRVLIAVVSVMVASASPLALSALELRTDRFDFGLSPQNALLVCRLWAVNPNDDTVRIADIKTGCGCVVVRPQPAAIPPGDSLVLSCSWQTRGFVGRRAVSAFLYDDSGERPKELVLSGNVVTDSDSAASVYWWPRIADFGGSSKRSSGNSQRTLRLTNRTEADLGMAVVDKGTEFNLEIPDSVAAGQEATVLIGLTDPTTNQVIESSFTVEFSGNGAEAFRVSVPVVKGNLGFRPKFTTNKQEQKTEKIR